MSSTVRSFGFICELALPLNKSDKAALEQLLEDKKNGLSVNYEGSLLILDYNQEKPLSEREELYHLSIGTEGAPADLWAAAMAVELAIWDSTTKSFESIWYNGSDNPVHELTLAQFREYGTKAA